MCLGLMIDGIDIKSPNKNEIDPDPFFSRHNISSEKSITMNKLLSLKQARLYCNREGKLTLKTFDNISATEPQHSNWIVSPFDVTLKLMIAYQNTAQIFGPVIVDLTLTPLTVNLSDEQVTFYIPIHKRLFIHTSILSHIRVFSITGFLIFLCRSHICSILGILWQRVSIDFK